MAGRKVGRSIVGKSYVHKVSVTIYYKPIAS
jgi:hypothetical protein